ncbi:phenylalanine--tRNA ligase subunit beta [Cohaesibacter gelatinilyticus]|uniref:Phenylalanine--tRNA ligase beta subunit n=1 Tax=Cohaesibacter gelatinilyticus TaxID=372072 RepID=A0A285PEA0_9HYPH|nr:phenylalanine--tRNA ligase subunit beta [Cohaesibacter gelatinilyticus]SNZ20049.1 phenylalanyl-tRNA synthetase beta subunit [Cohaesibacter gelatinilyticus]
MKFTLSWLKDYLETDASLEEILEKLTIIGLEVEEVIDQAAILKDFTVAYVEEAEQHPDADRLRVCKVNTGKEVLQIVCGAPNARAGIKVVLAENGAVIPTNGMKLKPTKIRGVESNGMMCSEREMGLSEEHDGIIELPENAPIGEPFAPILGLDDPVIDIAITPNRGDALGVYGVARDLAGAGLGTLREKTPAEIKGTFESPVGIELKFEDGDNSPCPIFTGIYVKGVKNGPSPDWMQARLRAIGLRPINALVDITNYISYDRGRPLHVYDADKLTGNIHARLGREGEKLTALDGKEYDVPTDVCVIADDSGAIGFGGIMGGESTGSSDVTTNVLIECAWFDPIRIAKSGRTVGIQSDARYRFERTVDPAFVIPGQYAAAQMVMDLCGGEPSNIVIAGEAPVKDKIIDFPMGEVKRLAGLETSDIEIKTVLKRLGFWVSGNGEDVKVAVPTFRPDIHGKADIVEEVVRVIGVDQVKPIALPRLNAVTKPPLTARQVRIRNARRNLAARGMVEAVTWSFTEAKYAKMFGGGKPELTLINPISSDLSDMRPSLLPGLMQAAQRNVDRGFNDLALFEVGQIFLGDKPEEQFTHATGLRRGAAKIAGFGRHWRDASGSVDVFDVRADALAVLESMGMDSSKLQIVSGGPDWYHPGRSGKIQLGPKNVIGTFGELHPKILDQLKVDGPICAFEITIENVPTPKKKATKSKPALVLSDLQPLRRDFAFVVDTDVSAATILRAANGADKKLIAGVNLFDLYEGEHMAEGKKSVAFEVTLQPKDKTLTDEEIEAISNKIVAAVTKSTGGELRG